MCSTYSTLCKYEHALLYILCTYKGTPILYFIRCYRVFLWIRTSTCDSECRILAAAEWHEDKAYLAQEVSSLRRLKMQQLSDEIELAKQMYGENRATAEQSYQDWLQQHTTKPTESDTVTAAAAASSTTTPAASAKTKQTTGLTQYW